MEYFCLFVFVLIILSVLFQIYSSKILLYFESNDQVKNLCEFEYFDGLIYERLSENHKEVSGHYSKTYIFTNYYGMITDKDVVDKVFMIRSVK